MRIRRKNKRGEHTDNTPITSARQFEELRRTRKEINATNKQRARAMERRIAKQLRGNRTPMSGAGYLKGDVNIPFVSRPGSYMIECKLSAATAKESGDSVLAVRVEWLDKMHAEATAIRALFPALVIHYHNKPGDYVLVRSDHPGRVGLPDPPLPVSSVHDYRDGKPGRKSFVLPYSRVHGMTLGGNCGVLVFPSGTYYVLDVLQFAALMQGI